MSTVTFVQNCTNSTVLEGVHNITLSVLKDLSDIPNLEWKFVYTPIPHFYIDRSVDRGGNVMGLNNTQSNLISKYNSLTAPIERILILSQWFV